MTLDIVLRCVTCALTLVATLSDARIDSDSILVFPVLHPRVWSYKTGLELIIFVRPKVDAMQSDV